MRSYEYIGRYILDLHKTYDNQNRDLAKFKSAVSGENSDEFFGGIVEPEVGTIRDEEGVMFFMIGVDKVDGLSKTVF
jgi:hypothetical protein